MVDNTQSLPTTLEVLPIEINLDRFLLIGLYKAPSVCEKEFLLHLNKAHNFFSTKYENITLIGDFNTLFFTRTHFIRTLRLRLPKN